MDITRHLPDLTDTIVALSSAPGKGARAIVRLSGPEALALLDSVFKSMAKPFPARGVFTGELNLPELHEPLPAQVQIALAPRSYTGQNLVEFHLPGSPPLVDCLIRRLLSIGSRAALPGEFTMRAFLANKIDLTQAEGVLGTLQAENRDELKQALGQLAGGVLGPMRQLREDLLCLLADLEAGLDFAEEDIHFIAAEDMLRRLQSATDEIGSVLDRLRARTVHSRPIRVVLLGRPNEGKSSLFNALLGTDAALISPAAGTTRDYLREVVRRDGIDFELIDTAGVHEAADSIEAQAQLLGLLQQEEADVKLICSASGDFLGGDPQTASRQLLVRTKCDLHAAKPGELTTSARSGAGLEALWHRLVTEAKAVIQATTATHAARSVHHLGRTVSCLDRARTSVNRNEPELVALEIRGALAELGELTGAVFTDDLLDRIFSRFCIGK
jgi:tRNA modification GTPase